MMFRAQPKALDHSGFGGKINSLARRFAHKVLGNLTGGTLTLCDQFHSLGETTTFGHGSPQVTLRIHSANFYRRILLGGNIGAAESYIDAEWDCDNLPGLVQIMASADQSRSKLEGIASKAATFVSTISHQFRHNDITNARANIMAHYDVGNDMYKQFLDERMIYSSAIFPSKNASLDAAQEHKLKTICDKLRLTENDHLLEIGTGWGGLAIYAAKHYGCKVTTTTISDAQFVLASERVEKEGLGNKITLLKKDYRLLEGKYDKLASIEMIEAVGHEYLPKFFDTCNELLKPNGLMLIQAITYRDQDYSQYLKSVDFIQKHIFPGGCLLSVNDMLNQFTSYTDMSVYQIESFGLHYAETLRLWRERFEANRNHIESLGYDERFMRLWRYYFAYCEGGFYSGRINVVQILSQQAGSNPTDTCIHGSLATES